MRIVLGVCGSISAYKSYDLARLYVKAGHEVRVILTSGAQKFILPDTFLHLGVSEVYTHLDDFNSHKKIQNVLHIDLKNWMDQFVIAPASANTLAKLAGGFCDDLLTSLFLTVLEKPIIIFPAMNTNMLDHPMTQANLDKIQKLENTFIHPCASGLLACGDEGAGKLPEIQTIFEFTECYSSKQIGKEVVITTGATIAPLDPVRYLTNPASGKTGYLLAKEFLKSGYNVTLIYGHLSTFPKEALRHHPHLKLSQVQTTDDMSSVVAEVFPKADVYISTAAISDIKFDTNEHKVKKTQVKGSELSFSWAEDILASVLTKKTNQLIIGFAAETDASKDHFVNKWKRKPVDLLVGNYVNSGTAEDAQGFGTDGNHYTFIAEGKELSNQSLAKSELAEYLRLFVEGRDD